MPTYEYQSSAGEVREIHQRMNDPHPEAVLFAADGSWSACDPSETEAYCRVYGNAAVNGDLVRDRYPVVSTSFHPDNISLKEAPTRTREGFVVIENKEHARRLAGISGFTKVE